jgi:hypothetical protein
VGIPYSWCRTVRLFNRQALTIVSVPLTFVGGRVLICEVVRMLSHSPDDTAASILTFRCPPELRVRIERQAATEYLPIAAVIRRAVARDLEAQEASRPTA